MLTSCFQVFMQLAYSSRHKKRPMVFIQFRKSLLGLSMGKGLGKRATGPCIYEAYPLVGWRKVKTVKHRQNETHAIKQV